MPGRHLVARDLRQWRLLLGADVLRLPAAGTEPAAGRRVDRARYVADQEDPLALRPKVVICDEPVSALDVSIQAQVVALLADLQREFGLSYVFIAHDLGVVRQLAHRVAVMYLGKVVETGTAEQVYERPTHPYTQALLSAVPVPDPELRGRRSVIRLTGDVPSPANPPSGCRFRTRCWKARERCAIEEPPLADRAVDWHPSACHYAELQPAT